MSGPWVLRRLAGVIPTLLLTWTIVFFVLQAIPGDPVMLMLAGTPASEESIQAERVRLGLDRPVLEQYATFIGRMATGDLGTSFRTREPVLSMIADQMGYSLSLAVGGLLVGVVLFSLLFYAPLLLQGGFGLSPQQAGLLITPMVVCITLGSIVNGRIITRIEHPNIMLYAGFTLLALACAGIITTRTGTPHWLFAAYMFAAGLGLGFVMPNLTVFTQQTAGRSQLGIATALLQSLRMVGGMVGTAAVGTVVAHRYAGGVGQALHAQDAGHAGQWLDRLGDPQILVDPQAHARFLEWAAQQGHDGVQVIEAARAALVGAIHSGQLIALAVAVLACWFVRRLPPIQLAHVIK